MKKYVHLPHNAIYPEEFIFLIKVALKYKNKKEWIEKKALKKYFLLELLRTNKFLVFHKRTYSDFKNGNVFEKSELFLSLIQNPSMHIIDICLKTKKTEKKTFGQIWNEIYRDYEELLSWMGILPVYHKGLNKLNAPKHIFVSSFAEKSINDKNFLLWLFINLKYKNSTKNWMYLKEYNNNIQPIWKILIKAKDNGYILSKDELAFVATNITNDDDDFKSIDVSRKREFGRVRTFLNKWLKYFNIIEKLDNNKYTFNRKKIDYILLKMPSEVAFVDQMIGEAELTPLIILKIYSFKKLYMNHNKLNNFDAIKNARIELELLLNLTIETYIEINPYSDSYFPNILSLELQNKSVATKQLSINDFKDKNLIISDESKKRFIDISKSSNGDKFEIEVFNLISKLFKNVNREGVASTGKRLSDIWSLLMVDGQKVGIVIETKSGKSPLDDRKESDNLLNTIKKIYQTKNNENFEIDYIWYWYVTNGIPDKNIHGGHRDGDFKKSFGEKLSHISREVLLKTGKPVFVMAISPENLILYLEYIYDKTKYHPIEEVFSTLVSEVGYTMTIFRMSTWAVFKKELIFGYKE